MEVHGTIVLTFFFLNVINCAKAKICGCTWGEKPAPWECQGLTQFHSAFSFIFRAPVFFKMNFWFPLVYFAELAVLTYFKWLL